MVLIDDPAGLCCRAEELAVSPVVVREAFQPGDAAETTGGESRHILLTDREPAGGSLDARSRGVRARS